MMMHIVLPVFIRKTLLCKLKSWWPPTTMIELSTIVAVSPERGIISPQHSCPTSCHVRLSVPHTIRLWLVLGTGREREREKEKERNGIPVSTMQISSRTKWAPMPPTIIIFFPITTVACSERGSTSPPYIIILRRNFWVTKHLCSI